MVPYASKGPHVSKEYKAGTAAVNITPDRSLHLFGYPHVARQSTGTHDPLFSTALYLESGAGRQLFVGNDVIFVPKDMAGRARKRIAEATGVSEDAICLTATHTHSGPDTVLYASNAADDSVPPPDEAYLVQLEDGIVEAATRSVKQAVQAEISFAVADGACVGGNRRDPAGPAIAEVPVWLVRNRETQRALGLMLICSMHPTVLHEDSTEYSGDFPGFTRKHLQDNLLGGGCPVIYHTGACGNQSPRHVVTGNTLPEAERLGVSLANNIIAALDGAAPAEEVGLGHAVDTEKLPLRRFPGEAQASTTLDAASARFKSLKASNPDSPETRTAECDLFGAQETLTLATLAQKGTLQAFADACMPAEVQCFRIGDQRIAAFPGEIFVEFVIQLQAEFPNLHVLTMANGELQGYLVTEEALEEGGYEASNALFKSPDGAELLMDVAAELLCDPALESR
jgi:neutral ceramidase